MWLIISIRWKTDLAILFRQIYQVQTVMGTISHADTALFTDNWRIVVFIEKDSFDCTGAHTGAAANAFLRIQLDSPAGPLG